jgi:hypothetical protein
VKVIGLDFEHPSEDTVFAPLLKAPVHGGRGSIALRQIGPRASRAAL